MINETFETRLEKLEVQAAWQDETIEALNRTIAHLQDLIHLQQGELHYLYRKLKEQTTSPDFALPEHDKPPHY